MKHDERIRLADGRALGYAEYGDPAGEPLFLFHGFPGARRSGALADDAGRKLAVRVIAPERPGMGLSDFKPGRKIADWPADVVELADALGVARFAVAGISGGGPYAAACARFIPERLTACAIVCGVGEFGPGATQGMSRQNRILFAVSRFAPWLVGAFMAPVMRRAKRDPERFAKRMAASMPEVDRRVLERPEVREAMLADMAEQGPDASRAISQEGALYVRPWGFRLEDIDIAVHLYQGELDVNVAPVMGHDQAARIPKCIPHFYTDEAHLSLVVNRVEEILGDLRSS